MLRLIPAILLAIVAIGLGLTLAYPLFNRFVCGFLALLVVAGWAAFRVGISTKKQNRRYDMSYATCLAIVIATTASPFLFQARFSTVEDRFTELAKSHSAGENLHLPLSIGTFEIVKVGSKQDGSTFFWTNDAPAGPEGFVYNYQFQYYNPFSELKLNEKWHYVAVD